MTSSSGADSRVVLIADAAVDIGPQLVHAFDAQGARVIAVRSASPAVEPTERGTSLALPVCSSAAYDEFARILRQTVPRLDVVVHCDNRAEHEERTFENLSGESWERTFQSNVLSAMQLARVCAPLLTSTGKILFLSTAVSQANLRSSPVCPAYEAANAALERFARSLAVRLGPRGVSVNALCTGNVDKPAFRAYLERAAAARHGEASQLLAEVTRSQVLTGLVPLEDVVRQVLHLTDPVSRYVTGQRLSISGGMEL
jgi:NAD(P)-dependent dehydrogenase (short-subunit alcohol dehydrogenase family)